MQTTQKHSSGCGRRRQPEREGKETKSLIELSASTQGETNTKQVKTHACTQRNRVQCLGGSTVDIGTTEAPSLDIGNTFSDDFTS